MSNNMDLWGVRDVGFYRPTIDDIVNVKNALAKNVFGEDFDTSETTPQGMFFRVNAAAENKLLEVAEGIYYSIFPHTATGVSLDRLCETVNLSRENASYAEHRIRVYGTESYIIEAGTEFKSDTNVEFYSIENVAIDKSEIAQNETEVYYADVVVRCKQSGTVGNVSDIVSTVQVNTSINGVMYLEVVSYGAETETDPQLRDKYNGVVQGLGTNTASSIQANTIRVSGVNDVIIIDNNTADDMVVSDNLTVTAGSYAIVVYSDSGSNAEEIAQAIFEKQPLGIPQSGVESVDITDSSNTHHIVRFTYVVGTTVDVNIECNINNAFNGENGIQAIKDNISAYINGLGIGEEVVYTRLYDFIYNVTGVSKVTTLTMNDGTADIPINKIEIAKAGTISVTVTEV